MSTSPNLNRNLTAIGALLLVGGLSMSYFLFMPQLHDNRAKLATDKAQDSGLVADYQQLLGAQSQLTSAAAVLQNSGVSLDQARLVVPLTENIPSLYIQMEDIVGRYGNLGTPSYQIGTPSVDPAGGVKIPLSVTATGKYSDLKQFISTLQHNIRPVLLTSLSFAQPTGSDKSSGKGLFTLTGTGYVRAQGLSSAYGTTSTAAPAPTP